MDDLTQDIKTRYKRILPHLDERSRRLWLGNEALSQGWGGIGIISKATGADRETISKGQKEVERFPLIIYTGDPKSIRKEGGGRKKLTENDPTLKIDLEKLVNPTTRGDPERILLWTTKSCRYFAEELKKIGHEVSFRTVDSLLQEMGYSLQSNRKKHEGGSHPDRDAQFEYINEQCKIYTDNDQPIISIDCKKKELIGNLKNNGKDWRPVGNPFDVNVYDFPTLYQKAIPYGVFDIKNNIGWVNVGIDHDTAQFSVESIRRWWTIIGKEMYPNATKLMITSDCGGSNGYRLKLWKKELQKLANEEKITIKVCHLPPGTSKWNKIEHRLFSFISINWKGKPLLTYEVMLELISSTKTKAGLIVISMLDTETYPTGVKVSMKEMEEINLIRDPFHGDWNYSIAPIF